MPLTKIHHDFLAYGDKTNVVVFQQDASGRDQIDVPILTFNAPHILAISCLAVHPSEKWIFSGGETADLSLWNVEHERFSHDLKEHTGVICSLHLSQDGTRLLSTSNDKTLCVWDVLAGEKISKLEGHTDFVTCGEFSRDGQFIASGSRDKTVKVWKASNGALLKSFSRHADDSCEVLDLAISTDGSRIAVAEGSHLVVWTNGKHSHTFTIHEKWIWSVEISQDGNSLLSASADTTIKLWSILKGSCICKFEGHTAGVRSAVFSPDEKLVISGSEDFTIKVWSVKTGKIVRSFNAHEKCVTRVKVSRDALSVFSSSLDGTIKVWSLAKGTRLKTLTDCQSIVERLTFSNETQTLFASTSSNTTEYPMYTLDIPSLTYHAAFIAAMSRGTVSFRSIKLLLLGATMAGKSALLAALKGDEMPTVAGRSVATRLDRLRLTPNSATNLLSAVPPNEHHIASVMAAATRGSNDNVFSFTPTAESPSTNPLSAVFPSEQDTASVIGAATRHLEDNAFSLTPTIESPSASPLDEVSRHEAPPSSTRESLSRQHRTMSATSTSSALRDSFSTWPLTSDASVIDSPLDSKSSAMDQVRRLLQSELQEGHVDLDAFDFAGEDMFDSLPALFMGSESAYVVVFDLSVMDNTLAAERQYEHIAKWAHIIAHQVPTSDASYFRVIIVGTHLDVFPNDTVPANLLDLVSRRVLSLVGTVLGTNLIVPGDTPSVPFFQVGSKKKIGLAEVAKAMHAAVRTRQLPFELVAAQDLVGRWARLGKISLMCNVAELDALTLDDTGEQKLTLGSLIPDTRVLREALVPYLETAADLLVCRKDATSRLVGDSDTVIFDVPLLIAALELLCSVVMAHWGLAKSQRAKKMLEMVIEAASVDEQGPNFVPSVLDKLTASHPTSEQGIPLEVAQRLVWGAASKHAYKMVEVVEEPASATAASTSARVASPHGSDGKNSKKSSKLLRRRLFSSSSSSSGGASPVATKPEQVQLLAGANISDVPTFLNSLESLSLVYRHEERLLVPMLLPHDAPFVKNAQTWSLEVFLYQFVDTPLGGKRELPVSLATFHLMLVSLWRESIPESSIQATQRCANAMTMSGCVPVRLRLNANESFVRIELEKDDDPAKVWLTLRRICKEVCDHTRSLRWGWRGAGVLVPAHPHDPTLPLFNAALVAKATDGYHRKEEPVHAKLAMAVGQRVSNLNLEKWWVADTDAVEVAPAYSYAAALVVGVSCYKSSGNATLYDYHDLPGVVNSAEVAGKMWGNRGFEVRVATDCARQAGLGLPKVTKDRIREELLALCPGEGADKNSLLIVHLIGHGVPDSGGGLLLSDAYLTPSKQLSRLNLTALHGILDADVCWRGRNVLVICDFCNSGALVMEDITPENHRPIVGRYSRQVLTSALNDSAGYMTDDNSKSWLTEQLIKALDGENKNSAFGDNAKVISAAQLRRWLNAQQRKHQGLMLGRIWNEWDRSAVNSGDILLYRKGSGVIQHGTESII